MKIECSNINKNFGSVKALKNVNLTFESGHIIGLFGRNGAGKSTLLKCIGNRIYPTSGEITIEGTPLYDNTKLFSSIFMIGEENMFPSETKIRDIFSYLGDSGAGDKEQAFSLAKEFSLDVKKKWEKLSTGYRTIFKDILALSSKSSFVFFDEPVLGLDASYRDLFYEKLLSSFSPDRCFVVSTHLIEEIEPLVDRVVIIDKGEILREGDKEQVLDNVFIYSGKKESVMEATKNLKVIRKRSLLGKYSEIAEGRGEERSDVNIEKIDLQRYFVELTKEERNEN